jgi:hypothetical protein
MQNVSIIDPLGQTVLIDTSHCAAKHFEIKSFHQHVALTLQKPAFILQIATDNGTELRYLRSIGWHDNLLIEVKKEEDGNWTAYDCVVNPPDQLVHDLLRSGKQLFHSIL